jgi:hypothetical protein
MSKKIKYMELEMLQLASENAGNKAPKVIVMSKSKKAGIVVLSFQSSLGLQELLYVKVIGSVHAIWVFDPGGEKALRERGRGRSIPVQSGSFHAMVDLRSVDSTALGKRVGMGIFKKMDWCVTDVLYSLLAVCACGTSSSEHMNGFLHWKWKRRVSKPNSAIIVLSVEKSDFCFESQICVLIAGQVNH